MAGPKDRARGSDDSDGSVAEINARLSEAAATGAAVELILVLKGQVRAVPGRHRGRWRVRTGKGHIVSFRPEFVMALKERGATYQGEPRRRRPACKEGPSAIEVLSGGD